MTDKFRELSNRLAQGMNKRLCDVILISRMDGEDEFVINNYAGGYELIESILALTNFALKELPDFGQYMLCAKLKDVVIECEERIFQKGETE